MKKLILYIKTLLKGKLNVFHFINCFILLGTFVLPFVAGSFSGETKKESLSNYAAERVKDSTQSKDIMAISVKPTTSSGSLPIDETEFNTLYGIFRQENITFASGYNAHKEIEITIPELNDQRNYSIFHNAKDSTVKYNGHYKHWYYPIEYMFEAERLYYISRYMIYLTQSQADELLNNKGVTKGENDKYSENDYKSLIKQLIVVKVGGEDVNCVIGNIILENNYYYNGLKEILGDFIACAYYCPGKLERESFYFLNSYSYQNSYFMNYVNQTYSNKLYEVRLIKNNIIKEFDYDIITNFYKENYKNNNALYIVLIVLSLFLLSFVAFLNILKCWEFCYKYLLMNGIAIFIPYLIFLIISHFSHSIIWFSNSGISLFMYLFIYYVGINIVLFIINKIYNTHLQRKSEVCKK